MNTPTVIVTQVKSNRLVYFTSDQNYRPAQDDDLFFVSVYEGTLPSELKLENCWRWRFNGGQFYDTDRETPRYSTAETLLSNNRKALRQMLNDKINGLRAQFKPDLWFAEKIKDLQVSEAKQFRAKPNSSEEFKFLSGSASVYGCSLEVAAEHFLRQENRLREMLLETQTLFDFFASRIDSAQSQQDLIHLRGEMIAKISPELASQFKLPRDNARPVDKLRPLEPEVLIKEKARLRVQLNIKVDRLFMAEFGDMPFVPESRDFVSELIDRFLADPAKRLTDEEIDIIEAFKKPTESDLAVVALRLRSNLDVIRSSQLRLEKARARILVEIQGIVNDEDLDRLSNRIWNLGTTNNR